MAQENNYTDWPTIRASKYRRDRHLLENTCENSGLGLKQIRGIPTLRYCTATHLMGLGVELRYIQELLGHPRSTTMEIDSHVSSYKIGRYRVRCVI